MDYSIQRGDSDSSIKSNLLVRTSTPQVNLIDTDNSNGTDSVYSSLNSLNLSRRLSDSNNNHLINIDFNRIKLLKKLGEGGFGVVYKIKYDGFVFALKQLKLPADDQSTKERVFKAVEGLRREAEALQALGTCQDDLGRMCLLMEYINGMDLTKLIRHKLANLEWDIRRQISRDIANGLKFIHDHNILHRDIKPDNVLIEMEDEELIAVKIADFGICRLEEHLKGLNPTTFMGVGSLLWMAPEIVVSRLAQPTRKTDIYALGVVMGELASLKQPFSSDYDMQVIAMKKSKGIIDPMPLETPEYFKQLLIRCQNPDPKVRPDTSIIIEVLESRKISENTNDKASEDISVTESTSLTELGFDQRNLTFNDLTDALDDLQLEDTQDLISTTEQETPLSGKTKFLNLLDMVDTNGTSFEAAIEIANLTGVNPIHDYSSFCHTVGTMFLTGSGVNVDVERAVQYFDKAAKISNSKSMLQLGLIYKEGRGSIQPDLTKAFDYFYQGSILDDPIATVNLGEMYYYGLGCEKDEQVALQMLTKSNTDISFTSKSLLILGLLYSNPDSEITDYQLALDYFSKSSALGNTDADYYIANIYKLRYLTDELSTKTFKWASKGAAKDHIECTVLLGQLYQQGQGVEKDLKKGFELFKTAAGLGSSLGRLQLGHCYQQGLGVAQDMELGFYQYTLAAENDCLEALHNVALCYRDGKGVEQSNNKAHQLLTKAASEGYVESQYLLGKAFCLENIGVQLDLGEAINWLKLAVNQHHLEATFQLATIYATPQTQHFDINKAIDLTSSAASNGLVTAQVYLGELFYNSELIDPDYEASFQWFIYASINGDTSSVTRVSELLDILITKFEDPNLTFPFKELAANHGIPKGQFLLGLTYYKGLGRNEDFKLAVRWFEAAAANQYSDALVYLGIMYHYGHGLPNDHGAAFEKFQTAHDLANIDANYWLGLSYLKGYGVASDLDTALNLIEVAAANGVSRAQVELGLLYKKTLEDQSSLQAFNWFKLAADQDNLDGLYHLGDMYYNGLACKQNYTLAFSYFSRAAEAGHKLAQANLGFMYFNGFGCSFDPDLAFKWFLQGSEGGSPILKHNLAGCYRDGIGVKPDIELAMVWFKQTAEQDNYGPSQLELAKLYYMGNSIPKDYGQSFYYFTMAAENQIGEAMYYLSMHYKSGLGTVEDLDLSIDWLTKATEYQYPEAQYNLACLILEGQQVAYDPVAAFDLLVSASGLGYIQADLKLGLMLYHGTGVNKDLTLAIQRMLNAAHSNNVEAMYQCGILYEEGYGIKQIDSALKWLLKAAELDHLGAQGRVASYYSEGKSVSKDLFKAYYWYLKAAEGGSSEAQFNLGPIMFNGQLTEADMPTARMWFELAAQQNHALAANRLGQMLLNGQGGAKDKALGLHWIMVASQLDCPQAMYSLGIFYKMGDVVIQDLLKAFMYLKLAADQGHVEANFEVGNCLMDGIGCEKDPKAAVSFFLLAKECKHPLAHNRWLKAKKLADSKSSNLISKFMQGLNLTTT